MPPSRPLDAANSRLSERFGPRSEIHFGVAVRCISGANVPAIQSHGDRGLGRRNVVRRPFLGAWFRIRFG
jgi:hypothetical protein